MPLLMRPGLVGPRIGRPGLLGLAARTAVVAGTAGAVNGAMVRHQQEKALEAQEAAAYEQQTPTVAAPEPPAAPAAGPSAADHRIEQLQQLAQLRAQGVLTDAEFAEQKAQVLGTR